MSAGQNELHHLLNEMPLDPGSSLIFVGDSYVGRDIHDTIEDWTTKHGVTVMFFQMHTFEQNLADLMEKTIQKNRMNIYRKLLNFIVFCDGINNCLTHITEISSRKDKEYGLGTLLRHFSKWLFITVDPPLLSEVHADLDNIAMAVKANRTSSAIISTLLWKRDTREWSQVGIMTNNGQVYATFVDPLFPNTAYMLNGRKLRIGILEWSEFCKKTTSPLNDSIVYTQVCKELFDSLSGYLNFTYELTEPAEKIWGELSETWNGLLGIVARNEVDLCGIPYGITLKRSQTFTFSNILYQGECEVVHKKLSTYDNHWTLLVSVFQWEVYVCGLLTMACCIVLYTVLERYCGGVHSKEIASTSNSVMTALRVPLHQASHHCPQTIPGRIFYASWWLFCIPIVAVYTGNLLAIISVAKEKIPFNTMEELAENEDFKIIIPKGSSYEDMYKNNNDSVSKRIWTNVLESRSANIQDSLDEGLQYEMLVQSGHYALITTSITIDSMEKTANNLRRIKCNTGLNYLGLPFPLNSPLAELFSDTLIRLYDNGLLEAWGKKWYGPKRKEQVPAIRKVDLSNLRSVWLMCSSGIALAFITLGVERFLMYRMTKT
ncbi:probable glutamate receptor [Haliotis asinina]|uniref:probable glutamate receptor n=1 Tax=Haliotis asinina TaxID=109174 RepID=UPI0035327D79